MSNIDCFVIYSEKEVPYVQLLKKTAEYFKSSENKLHWKCILSCDDTKTIVNGFKYLGHVPNWKKRDHASMNHSIGLNQALNHIENDYVIFMDSDIAILYPEWDKEVVYYLNNGYDCFGTSFGDNGPRYRNFPGIFFFSFKKEVNDKVKLDFSPILQKGKDSPLKETIKNKQKAKHLGCNIGEVVKHDTAAMIPILMKEEKMKGYAMPRILGKDDNHLLPFKDKAQKKFCLQKEEHMCEWHHNEKLFLTHKQAGR